MGSILRKVFRALSASFSPESIQILSAIRTLRILNQARAMDVRVASCELFKSIMASKNLTDRHWEAARLVIHHVGASLPGAGESKEILRFLDYHLGLQGAGEDHSPFIASAFAAIRWFDPLIVECIRNFNCASPSFVGGIRSIIRHNDLVGLQVSAIHLLSLASDQWFNSPVPIMEPEEMFEFCEHLAVSLVDGAPQYLYSIEESSVTILCGMFRSPEWRKHIATRLWSVFAYSGLISEEEESFRWCLRNAVELLEFTRSLPDSEGSNWWYATLQFHYDKLEITVRDEVERIARDMSLSDGSSDHDSYLNLIRREVTRMQRRLANFSTPYLPSAQLPAGFPPTPIIDPNYHVHTARVANTPTHLPWAPPAPSPAPSL